MSRKMRTGSRLYSTIRMAGISSFEQLLRDASIVVSQADLYGGGTSAVVIFIKDSAQHELHIDVNDKPRLLKLLRTCNVKVRSHFNLTRS